MAKRSKGAVVVEVAGPPPQWVLHRAIQHLVERAPAYDDMRGPADLDTAAAVELLMAVRFSYVYGQPPVWRPRWAPRYWSTS